MKRIVISGSSNSGKSLLVDTVRDHCKDNSNVYVPRRFITRPAREGQNQTLENYNISHEDFQEKLEQGIIGPYWSRFMEILDDGQQRTELYGFEGDEHIASEGPTPKLLVYSANNDCIRRVQDGQPEGNVQTYFKDIIHIHIDCPREDRLQRMREREDDLLGTKTREAEYRLDDDGNDVRDLADIVIDNSIKNQDRIRQHILKVIESIT